MSDDERQIHDAYRRAQRALEAAAAAIVGRACLTPAGARYLGVPFDYPQRTLLELVSTALRRAA